MKILLIEDNREIITGISLTFKLRWPDADVFFTEDGKTGIEKVRETSPDVVVLDINLPDIDGFNVLKSIRQFSAVPVIILTVRGDEVDELRGLESGADDYITKPFRPANLLVRVQAVLRRSSSAFLKDDAAVSIGNVTIDPVKMEVCVDGEILHLTRNEGKILFCLASNADRVVTLETLKKTVWGKEAEVIDNNALKRYIFQLRSKLGDNGNNPSLILNEHGIGYKLGAGMKSGLINQPDAIWRNSTF